MAVYHGPRQKVARRAGQDLEFTGLSAQPIEKKV